MTRGRVLFRLWQRVTQLRLLSRGWQVGWYGVRYTGHRHGSTRATTRTHAHAQGLLRLLGIAGRVLDAVVAVAASAVVVAGVVTAVLSWYLYVHVGMYVRRYGCMYVCRYAGT